jgi:hypothetical protein
MKISLAATDKNKNRARNLAGVSSIADSMEQIHQNLNDFAVVCLGAPRTALEPSIIPSRSQVPRLSVLSANIAW